MKRIITVLLCLLPLSALAVIEAYEFDTPEQQARFALLTQELRCPKCQNQNIADSDAPIAQDLRQQLHRQLLSGADDETIKSYMVDRYGEFVLYRPRMAGATVWLWAAPVLLLMAGLVVLVAVLRRQRTNGNQPSAISPIDQAAVDALLNDAPEAKSSQKETSL